MDLSDCSLLGKCLYGKTQTNNESLNCLVWRYCPKEIFVSRWAVTDAACFSVAIFNEGNNDFLELFNELYICTEFYDNRSRDFGFRTRKSPRKFGVKSGLSQKRLKCGKKCFIGLYVSRYPFIPTNPLLAVIRFFFFLFFLPKFCTLFFS